MRALSVSCQTGPNFFVPIEGRRILAVQDGKHVISTPYTLHIIVCSMQCVAQITNAFCV